MQTTLHAGAILLMLLAAAPAGAQQAPSATTPPGASPPSASAPSASPPAAAPPAAASGTETGLQVVERLGLLNGQALACSATAAVTRARQLMLTHAPRTPQYGGAFEQATQAGFRLQIAASTPCPSPAELVVSIEQVARALREVLPANE